MTKAISETATDNDNYQLPQKPSFADVEDQALRLCVEYDNEKFFEWYCLVINILGLRRIAEIQSMYAEIETKELAAKLFSSRASQEAKRKIGIERYQHLKSQYGGRKKT